MNTPRPLQVIAISASDSPGPDRPTGLSDTSYLRVLGVLHGSIPKSQVSETDFHEKQSPSPNDENQVDLFQIGFHHEEHEGHKGLGQI